MQNTAKGQITLVSISDGSTALFYIEENESTELIYDTKSGDTYIPNYSKDGENLKLTPVLTINGYAPTDVTYDWKDVTSGTAIDIKTTENGKTIAAISSEGVLTIMSNLTTRLRFLKCTATFKDPITKVGSTIVETVVLNRIDTAGTNVTAQLHCTTKDYVQATDLETTGSSSSIDNSDDHVELEALTYYGTSLYTNGTVTDSNGPDQGFITYTWSYYNFHTNSFTQFGTNGAASVSGCLNENDASSYNTISYFKKDPDETNDSTYSYMTATSDDWSVMIKNNKMYIKADGIDVNECIRCTVDLYSVSNNSKGESKGSDSAILSVFDKTDNYTLDIEADTTVLSSSVNNATLTATITHNGEELTTSSYNLIYWDWDAYQYDNVTSSGYVEWPEYSYDATSKLYTRITKGTENGTGYWLSGITAPAEGGTVSSTTTGLVPQPSGGRGSSYRKVTVYRSQVGNNSRVNVVAYLNGINAKAVL